MGATSVLGPTSDVHLPARGLVAWREKPIGGTGHPVAQP